MKPMSESNPYALANRGSFKGIRHWHELDLSNFIETTDQLLHEQHQEDYCGIVYVDNIDTPEYIKIYDPANLGVVCGYSDNPPLPGWILSRLVPCDLHPKKPQSLWKKYLHRFN